MSGIAFVLPVGGGGGGAHSVVQEVTAMRALGFEATIFVNEKNLQSFKRTYARFDWVSPEVKVFTGPKDLAELLSGVDLAVATTNTSVHSIAEAMAIHKRSLRTGYYVQDYEPLFYEVSSEHFNTALSSFGLLTNCTYFAKTRWLRDIVYCAHKIPVSVVIPSIDHGIYHPAPRAKSSKRVVAAMVRPQTPRRAPHRTIRSLARAIDKYGDSLEVRIFGADVSDLREHNVQLYPGVEVLGRLLQTEVASLLQQSDYLIDLSDYQAFGRTAAEAMACGAISLAPSIGGTPEFIDSGNNSFLVDTRDEGLVFQEMERMFTMSDQEVRMMRLSAIESVAGFTPTSAALSELRAFGYA